MRLVIYAEYRVLFDVCKMWTLGPLPFNGVGKVYPVSYIRITAKIETKHARSH